ncbi:MAG: oxygenase MpaB family protein, partial [Casimicrobium sp.]
LRADPLADATVSAFLGAWIQPAGGDVQTAIRANAVHWLRIEEANRLLAQWTSNAALNGWKAVDEHGAPIVSSVAQALEHYVAAARTLPEWANADQIERAEQIFFDHGVLSCLLLFCASLPECYVLPDLSDVLHVAGQLEKHTEYRVRSTAAMIFPVMMRGGLTAGDGAGVAQVLKVRLIHAMIRNLILRGDPQNAVALMQSANNEQTGLVKKLNLAVGDGNMYETLFAHGWDLARDGLPCNQEELAYTLLTFHYVAVRGFRTLGVPLLKSDELAYLHAWNTMAHVLGVDRRLMPQTMEDAEALFAKMQARGRADAQKRPGETDPRPKLGQALIKSMEDVIPLRVLKGFPSLLTFTLCGPVVARELGILGRAGLLSKVLYWLVMSVVRTIDTLMRVLLPQFSLSRMLSRIFGYHLMSKFLMDQTRPLKLPQHLLNRMNDMVEHWSDDRHAPRWLNRIEDLWTARGSWREAIRAQAKGSK